ncbi:MAG: KH domain-containing protein [Clostridiales bacterium]|nr:KH domain-containing protein [Clostridiales bacterium]
MVELVKYIVGELVENKEAIEVTEKEESAKVTVLSVTVDKEDVGRVIGRNGKVANSLRTIVKSASIKSGKRFIVKIGERD